MSIFTNEVLVDNTVLVDGSATTQPISAAALPLPAGAATNAAVQALTKPTDVQLVDGSAHTQPISGTVSISGVVSVLTAVASSATVTQVTQLNTTDTILLAANSSRKSAIIFLPKSGTGVKYGTGASAASFTYKTGSSNTTIIVTGYTGPINSFGTADTINVTELT